MKKAVKRIQFLQNISKTFKEGNYEVTLQHIETSLQSADQADIKYAEKWLLEICPFMHQIKQYLRFEERFYQFLRELTIERLLSGQRLFSQGEIGRKMYFVLSGALKVGVTDKSFTLITKGRYFGELSLHYRVPRTCDVDCQANVVLLTVSYETYAKYVYYAMDNHLHDQLSYLKLSTFFQGWGNLALSLILHHFSERKIQRNKYIYKQDSEDQHLYYLQKGSIKLVRRVGEQEQGLLTLFDGSCFGDFEFQDPHQTFALRSMSAQVESQAQILQMSFKIYIQIMRVYHPHLEDLFFSRSNTILQQRMSSIIDMQPIQIKMPFNSVKQQEIMESLEMPNRLQVFSKKHASVTNILKPQSRERKSEQQIQIENKDFFVSLRQIQTQTNTKFNFSKFERILILKKIRDTCNIPFPQNMIPQQRQSQSGIRQIRSRVASLMKLDDPQSVIIKSYSKQLNIHTIEPKIHNRICVQSVNNAGTRKSSLSLSPCKTDRFKFELVQF